MTTAQQTTKTTSLNCRGTGAARWAKKYDDAHRARILKEYADRQKKAAA